MAKKGKFQSPFLPSLIPSIDIKSIKEAYSKAVSKCGLSRDQIADAMSAILRKRITVHMLNAWTALTKPQHLPRADEEAAFLMVTRRPEPLAALGTPAGIHVIGDRDFDILRLAQLRDQRLASEREMAEIEKRLEQTRNQP